MPRARRPYDHAPRHAAPPVRGGRPTSALLAVVAVAALAVGVVDEVVLGGESALPSASAAPQTPVPAWNSGRGGPLEPEDDVAVSPAAESRTTVRTAPTSVPSLPPPTLVAPDEVWVLPSAGEVTSEFGPRWGRQHSGLDLAAGYGAQVHAASAGTVLDAGWSGGYGLRVQLQHEWGVVTTYGHASQLLVEVGDVVEAGDLVALEGSTGRSTGPHVHFEVRLGGVDGPKVDPRPFLEARGVEVPPAG